MRPSNANRREALRARIAADTEAYRASGGVIHQVDHTANRGADAHLKLNRKATIMKLKRMDKNRIG